MLRAGGACPAARSAAPGFYAVRSFALPAEGLPLRRDRSLGGAFRRAGAREKIFINFNGFFTVQILTNGYVLHIIEV